MAIATDQGKRGRGPNDPARRARIAQAAIEVVATNGAAGLTHRAVAAAAGVPLGSTTYYFASRDDLLAEALHAAAEHNIARLREWEAGLGEAVDLASALASLTMAGLTAGRPQSVVEYELYIAALHRPRLRQASAAWDSALVELFARRTDADTGRALAAAFCGLMMQALLADPPPDHADLRAVFARVLQGDAA